MGNGRTPYRSYLLIVAGITLALLGWTLNLTNPVSFGLVGFGLAHIVLGLLGVGGVRL